MPPGSRLAVVVLAAGHGTRMRSLLPKVLHSCADVPILAHVLKAAVTLQPARLVVVVAPGNKEAIVAAITPHFANIDLTFVIQPKALGTGDAARIGLEALDETTDTVLLLYGDTPLIQTSTLKQLLQQEAVLKLVTAKVQEPFGYGRIWRAPEKNILAVIEQKDTTPAQALINEINVGIYCGQQLLLQQTLAKLRPNNQQKELYLTDTVALIAQQHVIAGVELADTQEMLGVNTQAQLATAETQLLMRLYRKHQEQGVCIMQPTQCFIGANVHLESGVVLTPGTQLYGHCRIGKNCRIEGPSVLRDVVLEEGVLIAPFSHLVSCLVRNRATVGPYARIRAESDIGIEAHVGNFVEVKKTTLGPNTKANHLSYLGDSLIGDNTNIGAGTITCNYDGRDKHQTKIGNHVFVGSHTTFVAPLTIGDNACTAAGSVITEDVPQHGLAFGRARQVNKEKNKR